MRLEKDHWRDEGLSSDGPSGVVPHELERHFTIQEIAEAWQLDPSTVRKMFAHHPRVLTITSSRLLSKSRGYTTLRIPASVMTEVYQSRLAGSVNQSGVKGKTARKSIFTR